MTLDAITFSVIAAAATGSAMAPITGDSAVVRSAPNPESPLLIAAFTKAQTAGTTQIVFPYGHDTTRNIRYRNVIASPMNMLPNACLQPMKSQDLITATLAATAVAGDVELLTLLMAYPELGGGSDKFIGYADFMSRVDEFVTIEDTITPTVASTYSGARALNAVTTSLKANRDYAVIGCVTSQSAGNLTIRGQDTGNLRCAMPASAGVQQESRDWFVQLAAWSELPMIPVINAANQSGTFIEIVQDENLAAVPFSLLLALLK